jgi:hypothetical protein
MIARFFFMPVFLCEPNRLYRVWTRSGDWDTIRTRCVLRSIGPRNSFSGAESRPPRSGRRNARRAAAEAERLGGRVALKAQSRRAAGRRPADPVRPRARGCPGQGRNAFKNPSRHSPDRRARIGRPRILVEEASPLLAEFYVGAALDRPAGRIILLASPFGGTDIEETARIRPEAVFREDIDPFGGLKPYQARRLSSPSASREARHRPRAVSRPSLPLFSRWTLC